MARGDRQCTALTQRAARLNVTTGQSLQGHVLPTNWPVYAMDVAAGTADVLLTVTQSSATQDVDVYVRFNAVPTRNTWDFRNITTAVVSLLRIPNPQIGRYFVMVVSNFDTSYTIAATQVRTGPTTCPSACSGQSHGRCVQGRCTCEECYQGERARMRRLLRL